MPTLTTTATTGSELGSYDIDVGGTVDPDYTITYVQGTLTVTTATDVTSMLVENGITERILC